MDQTPIATSSMEGIGIALPHTGIQWPRWALSGPKGNNGIGVAGINWDVSLMLLRIGVQGIRGPEDDLARIDRVTRAIHYAADNGARIINWSGFVPAPPPQKLRELRQAIDYAAKKNVLIVVAAGNDLKDLDDDKNCGNVPACFENDNIIKVAEIDFGGELYRATGKFIGGSNYGVKRVDIAAIARELHHRPDARRCGCLRTEWGTLQCCAGCVWRRGTHAFREPKAYGIANEANSFKYRQATTVTEGKVKSGGIVDAYRAVDAAKDLGVP